MNYMAIYTNDIANGEGLRVTLFVSGCTLNCEGCHNPEAQDFNAGKPFTRDTVNRIITELRKPHIAGLTITGGHPLEEQNLEDVTNLILTVRNMNIRKTIWLYTGYTWDYIFRRQKLKNICYACDVVVDGPYEWWNRSTDLAFRGSSNQRIIDMAKSYEEKKLVLYEPDHIYPIKPWRKPHWTDLMNIQRGHSVLLLDEYYNEPEDTKDLTLSFFNKERRTNNEL